MCLQNGSMFPDQADIATCRVSGADKKMLAGKLAFARLAYLQRRAAVRAIPQGLAAVFRPGCFRLDSIARLVAYSRFFPPVEHQRPGNLDPKLLLGVFFLDRHPNHWNPCGFQGRVDERVVPASTVRLMGVRVQLDNTQNIRAVALAKDEIDILPFDSLPRRTKRAFGQLRINAEDVSQSDLRKNTVLVIDNPIQCAVKGLFISSELGLLSDVGVIRAFR